MGSTSLTRKGDVRHPKRSPLIWPPELRESKRKRYIQIAQCLARGLNEKEIAAACGVSYHVIKKQVCEMHKYLGTQTLAEAVLKANKEWSLNLCDCRREAGQEGSPKTG